MKKEPEQEIPYSQTRDGQYEMAVDDFADEVLKEYEKGKTVEEIYQHVKNMPLITSCNFSKEDTVKKINGWINARKRRLKREEVKKNGNQ